MKQFMLKRDLLRQLIPVAATATVAAVLLVAPAVAAKRHADPSCSASPYPVAVGQSFTISASGLPTVDPVWLIVQPPSGDSTVSEVYVNPDGTWSGSEVANQAGTWTYTYSGLMQNRKYGAVATCTEQAN
jgi:hypothetical protein